MEGVLISKTLEYETIKKSKKIISKCKTTNALKNRPQSSISFIYIYNIFFLKYIKEMIGMSTLSMLTINMIALF